MPVKPPPDPADKVQMDTPVIDMQDLEHKPSPQTRVSNKGVKITPSMDGKTDTGKEMDEAIAALEKLEKSMNSGRAR